METDVAKSKNRTKRTKKPRKKIARVARRKPEAQAAGPVTLEEAKAMVRQSLPESALRSPRISPAASPASVGKEQEKLESQRQRER